MLKIIIGDRFKSEEFSLIFFNCIQMNNSCRSEGEKMSLLDPSIEYYVLNEKSWKFGGGDG